MLVACSLRYGGMLVSSEDCNHQSYLSLGLVCPNCQKPIFYVEGFDRKNSFRKDKEGRKHFVKGSKIPAHFRHFKEVPNELIEQCEARVKSITKKQVKDSQAKFRRQRKKLFDKRILDLLRFNPKFANYDFMLLLAKKDFLSYLGKHSNIKPGFSDDLRLKKFQRVIVNTLKTNRAKLYSEMKVILESFQINEKSDASFDVTIQKELIGKVLDKGVNLPQLQYLDSPLEVKMHEKICYEVLDYFLMGIDYGTLANVSFLNYYLTKVCFLSEVLADEIKHQDLEIEKFQESLSELLFLHAEIVTKAIFFPIEQIIEKDTFTNLIAKQSVFENAYFFQSKLQESSIPDHEVIKINKAFHEQTDNSLISMTVGAIATTPWMKAFEYFDKNLSAPKKVFDPQKLLLIDGSVELRTTFINLQKEQISNPETLKIQEIIDFNKTTQFELDMKSAAYSLKVQMSLELISKENQTAKLFVSMLNSKNNSSLCEAVCWTKYEIKKKDPWLKRIKKDYPEIDKVSLEEIKKIPCVIVDYRSEKLQVEMEKYLIWLVNIFLDKCAMNFALN